MPRASGSKDYISLAQGLITEASPLTFPENATADELNFLLDKDGLVRSRRKGLEAVKTEQSLAGTEAAVENVYYWREPDVFLFVVTSTAPDTKLYVHRNNEALTPLGNFLLNSEVTETQIAESTNIVVITTSEAQKPILLEYEKQNDNIEIYSVDLYVRDFELVDDGLTLTERPTTPIDDNHRYNLYNAGWYKDRRYQYVANQAIQDPIDSFYSDLNSLPSPANNYPSNADIVSLGVSINENGVTTFRDDEVRNTNVGNSEAPRGHYVYNINDFNRDARIADKNLDGTESTTLSPVGTVSV